jgi:hypothetical protein
MRNKAKLYLCLFLYLFFMKSSNSKENSAWEQVEQEETYLYKNNKKRESKPVRVYVRARIGKMRYFCFLVLKPFYGRHLCLKNILKRNW